MEKYLGASEHLFWLFNQFYPLDFATVAKLQGQFSSEQLSTVLRQVQQHHPLLRVRIATDEIGQPKFVETDDEIPLRLVARTDDRHWQAELEVELARSVDWQVAPLLRVVLLQSGTESELIILCHHAIADGLSGVYLMRDILQGLGGGKLFERSDLSTALSLESALPDIVPSPEAISAERNSEGTAKSTDYLPTQSRLPQPHIHTIVLPPELTQQLIQRSRAEHTTVHGAISAAFLLALTQQDVKPSDVMRCLHPVNVRSQLSLPMPDGVGLYISLCVTNHSLQADSAFWDVARSVKSQLLQTDIAQQLVEESQLQQSAMANLTDAVAFVEEVRSQLLCQLTVTNLGRIDMAQQYGNIRIEALHAPAVTSSLVERVVGVATLGDRLALTISSTPLMDVDRTESERAATAFLSAGVKHLELAVEQEVASVAACSCISIDDRTSRTPFAVIQQTMTLKGEIMTTTYHHSAAFNDLAALLTGQLFLPQAADYEQVRQLWNGKVKTQPAAIARCLTVQDVIHTVRWTRSHNLPLSVRAGGHDTAGRALSEGVVIDLSQMRTVTVDPDQRTAHVQAGATIGDLIETTTQYGLVTATGTCSAVGMAGFTLGGGYSELTGAYGLGIDNLLSAQVVTADGQLLTANAEEHPDLLWGLRGGGGNFGVVVSLEYRLHPLTTVLSGMLLYPLGEARTVLRRLNDFMATIPDELTILAGFIQMPEGATVLLLLPLYCGESAAGEQVIAPLRTFGTVLVDQVRSMTYREFIHQWDANAPKGRYYHAKTQSIKGFQPEIIDTLIEQGLPFSSPFSFIALHHFHGAASRVGASETAFALRQDHLMVELIAAWEPQDDEQRHIQWAQNISRSLAPYALKGGYISLLNQEEQERVRLAFGSNYERLLDLKQKYDPDDVFRSTIGHLAPHSLTQ